MSKFTDKLQGKIICKRYQLLKIIGKGAFGVVYKGFDKETQEEVAVKVIPKELQNQIPELRKLIPNEIEALRRLQSQHIIRYYGHYVSSTNFYIVMEYCNQGELYACIAKQKDGRFSETQALQYFEQIVCAYKEMFAKGVLHRDIKLENILIHNQQLKVADFGFCMIHDPNQLSRKLDQTVLGSPIYMAPEILEGKPRLGIKAEVYSLGVLLYTMLIGKPPYRSSLSPYEAQDKIYKDLAHKIKTQPLNFVNIGVRLSEQVRNMLTEMLQYDPQKRIDFNDLQKSPIFLELSDPARVRPKGVSNIQPPSESLNDLTELPVLVQNVKLTSIDSDDEEQKDETYYEQLEEQMVSKALVQNRILKLFDVYYEYQLNLLIQLTKIFYNLHNKPLCCVDNRIYALALILKHLYMLYDQLNNALLKDENIFKLHQQEFQLIIKTNQYLNFKKQIKTIYYPNILANYQLLVPDLCQDICQTTKDNRDLLKLLQQHEPDPISFTSAYRHTLIDYSFDLQREIGDINELVMPEPKQKMYYLNCIWVLNAVNVQKIFLNTEAKPYDFLLYENNLEIILEDVQWRQELLRIISWQKKQLGIK